MKKYSVLTIALAFGLFLMTSVSNGNMVEKNSYLKVFVDDNKTVVAAEDLPEAVIETLKGSDYEGYNVDKAYLVSETEGSYYEIHLLKGEESKKVHLTSDGKKREKEESTELR